MIYSYAWCRLLGSRGSLGGPLGGAWLGGDGGGSSRAGPLSHPRRRPLPPHRPRTAAGGSPKAVPVIRNSTLARWRRGAASRAAALRLEGPPSLPGPPHRGRALVSARHARLGGAAAPWPTRRGPGRPACTTAPRPACLQRGCAARAAPPGRRRAIFEQTALLRGGAVDERAARHHDGVGGRRARDARRAPRRGRPWRRCHSHAAFRRVGTPSSPSELIAPARAMAAVRRRGPSRPPC